MAVIISVAGGEIEATIDNGVWSTSASMLKNWLKLRFPVDSIENYTPWPDYTLAEMAVEALGGEIIEATDPPEYVEGRVY